MKKISKLIGFIFVLIFLCCMTLIGCSQTGQTTTTPAAAVSQSTLASASDSTSQAPKATEKPTVKIGVILPLSGANAWVGEEGANAVKLYFEQLKAKGDYPYNIELVIEDMRSDVNETITCATKLAERDKVIGVIGPWSSATVAASSPLLEKYKIPNFSVGAGVDALTLQGNTYYFRAHGNNSMQGQRVPIYLNFIRKWKNVVIVHQQNDYGVGLVKTISETGKRIGMNITQVLSYELDTTDFYTLIAKLKGFQYDGVIMAVGSAEELANFAGQANEMGLDLTKFFGVGVDIRKMAELIGAKGNGFSSNTDFDNVEPITDAGKAFVKSYNEKYGRIPSMYACQTVDATDILAQALAKAATPDGQNIREALIKNSFEAVSGTIEFDKNNQNFTNVIIQQIVDGKVKTIDTTQYPEYKQYYITPELTPAATPSPSPSK